LILILSLTGSKWVVPSLSYVILIIGTQCAQLQLSNYSMPDCMFCNHITNNYDKMLTYICISESETFFNDLSKGTAASPAHSNCPNKQCDFVHSGLTIKTGEPQLAGSVVPDHFLSPPPPKQTSCDMLHCADGYKLSQQVTDSTTATLVTDKSLHMHCTKFMGRKVHRDRSLLFRCVLMSGHADGEMTQKCQSLAMQNTLTIVRVQRQVEFRQM